MKITFEGISSLTEEAERIDALRKAFETVKKRQKENLSRISNIDARKRRLRDIKEKCVGNQKLLHLAIKNLTDNGIRVHLAKTREDALSLVLNEIGNEKLITKSKSNVTKELGLNKFLESKNIEVIETDIGDRIIQISKEKPSHPTGPASHLTRYDIAEIVFEHDGIIIDPDPENLTRHFKEEISAYINKSKIGITGANAIAAEEGAVMLLHNEGNVFEMMRRPEKHIILAGIDKIFPDLEEALNMAKLQTYYATGSVITSFINIIGGPSKTADIEKKLFKGIHGPREICIILVDNGRSQIIEKGFKELLYCIGCGECLLNCPIYNVFGSKYGTGGFLGGKGVAYSRLTDEQDISDPNLYLCVSCGRCKKNCPVNIDTPGIINKLRIIHPQKFHSSSLELSYDLLDSHVKWMRESVRIELLLLISKIMELQCKHNERRTE